MNEREKLEGEKVRNKLERKRVPKHSSVKVTRERKSLLDLLLHTGQKRERDNNLLLALRMEGSE